MTGSFSTLPVRQIAVEAVVWRARPCGNHDVYDAGCVYCVDGTHCGAHEEFDVSCARCRERKGRHDLGTIDHYHADPAQQARPDEIRRGVRVWRR